MSDTTSDKLLDMAALFERRSRLLGELMWFHENDRDFFREISRCWPGTRRYGERRRTVKVDNWIVEIMGVMGDDWITAAEIRRRTGLGRERTKSLLRKMHADGITEQRRAAFNSMHFEHRLKALTERKDTP